MATRVLFRDTFAGPDRDLVGGEWIQATGYDLMLVRGNAATGGEDTSNARVSVVSVSMEKSQWAECVITEVAFTANTVSLVLNANTTSSPIERWELVISQDGFRIWKSYDGTQGWYNALVPWAVEIGQRIWFGCIGDDMTAFVDGTPVISTLTDTDISAAPLGLPGLLGWRLSDNDHGAVNDFSCGIFGDAAILSTPTGTATGETMASGSVFYDVLQGTVYGYVSTSVTPPSTADHQDGTGAAAWLSDTDTQDGYSGFNWNTLTEDTLYYAHYLHVYDEVESTQATSASFTTFSSGTAPTLDTAVATKTGQNTATGSVGTDQVEGTVWAYVSESVTPPDVPTHKASPYSETAAATTNFTFTGLTAGTVHYVHYLQTNDYPLDSDQLTSASIRTDDIVVPPGPGPISEAFQITVDGAYITQLQLVSKDKTEFVIRWWCNTALGDNYVSVRSSGLYGVGDEELIKSDPNAVWTSGALAPVVGWNQVTVDGLLEKTPYYPGVVQEY